MDKVKVKVKGKVSPFLWKDFYAVFCLVLGMVQKVLIEISAPRMDFVALIKLRWCAMDQRTTTYVGGSK